MQSWILITILFVCVLLLIAFGFALWNSKTKKNSNTPQTKIPNAQELLELLKAKDNTLESLSKHSQTACKFYERYMDECDDFDLEFVAILTAHKNVNAKLILEIERRFKTLNPARKTLLDKALTFGLGHR
ncbi:hypothetical protein [Helicobacter turcicus]|uniref:Periplasmic protein n=1 Tax=Helicobacter turcicus TaxID=2867412 RepID=A0ABS7JLK9_9HELI|nr:hypothetical protein [Helicobacter turcicus]MBX7490256.1 hypothetical protein [Helicobacter turcicus]MBX7545165.1 hypothetical protein [Helicobacter turcicus]